MLRGSENMAFQEVQFYTDAGSYADNGYEKPPSLSQWSHSFLYGYWFMGGSQPWETSTSLSMELFIIIRRLGYRRIMAMRNLHLSLNGAIQC